MTPDMSNSDQDLPATPPPFKARDYTEYWLGQNPTPVERADVIVKRLEQFIREGRSQRGGISFKRWQELAVHEVDNAIRDAERHWRNDQRFITRGLAVGAACLITIGFWGTVLAAEAAPDRLPSASGPAAHPCQPAMPNRIKPNASFDITFSFLTVARFGSRGRPCGPSGTRHGIVRHGTSSVNTRTRQVRALGSSGEVLWQPVIDRSGFLVNLGVTHLE